MTADISDRAEQIALNESIPYRKISRGRLDDPKFVSAVVEVRNYLKDKGGDITFRRRTNEAHCAFLHEANAMLGNLTHYMLWLEGERERLQRLLTEAEKNRTPEEREMTGLRQENERLRAQRAAVLEENKRLLSDKDNQQVWKRSAESEIQGLKEENAALTNTVEDFEAHILELQDGRSSQPLSAADILHKAASIVSGADRAVHGTKERSLSSIAELWSGFLGARLSGADHTLTGPDVAMMMVLMKMGRAMQGETVRDHFYDMAGYAALAGEVALCKDTSSPA